MTDFLLTVHPLVGYVVSVVVLVAAVMAFGRARDAREFAAGPYSLAMVLLDIQVLLGILLYVIAGYWDAGSPMIAYVHPLLALAALAVGHASLGRARNERMAVEAHRKAGRGLLFALVLVLAAIGVASAA